MSSSALESDVEHEHECEQCGHVFTTGESPRPNHCSDDCYFLDKGAGLLNEIDQHREICSTCYALNRDLEPIPDSVHQDGSAFQYPNQHTVIGVDERDGNTKYRAIEHNRFSCRCGAVDPNERFEIIQDLDRMTVAMNLLRALRYLHCKEPDTIPHPPNKDAFYDTLESGWTGHKQAAGKAIYGGERSR